MSFIKSRPTPRQLGYFMHNQLTFFTEYLYCVYLQYVKLIECGVWIFNSNFGKRFYNWSRRNCYKKI